MDIMLRLVFTIIICFASDVHAFAPIEWMKFPAKGFVLMPWDLPGHIKGSAPPLKLSVRNPPSGMSPDTVPYFTTKPDKTITWGDNWCIEASGNEIGDFVIINYCNGRPNQRWNWVADGHGRNMIQLTDSNMCIDVVDREGGLNGSPVELRECEDRVTEAWRFEEQASQIVSPSSDIRHVMLLMTLLGVGVLTISAWFGRWQAKAQAGATRHGGTCGSPHFECSSVRARQMYAAHSGKSLGRNVQGKAPPLKKLTALRKVYPSACYPLLCTVVAESRERRLSLDDTFSLFAERWAMLGYSNPPEAPTSMSAVPSWPPQLQEEQPLQQSKVFEIVIDQDQTHPDRGQLRDASEQRSRRWGPKVPAAISTDVDGSIQVPMLADGVEAETIRAGMALYRGLLLPAAQQWLADLFFAIGDNKSRHGFGCFWRAPNGTLRLNYGHRAQYIDELNELPEPMRRLHAGLHALICGEGSAFSNVSASVAIMNYYGGRSNGMGWHVDADTDPPHVTPAQAQESAVISLSIGDACNFCFREPRSRSQKGRKMQSGHERLRLNSGDVLVFGGPSRGVEHCVDGLFRDTRPNALNMPSGRINITFRCW